MNHCVKSKSSVWSYQLRVGILTITALLASVSAATELNVSVYSETEYTSNAGLSRTDAKEDVVERVGLNVLLKEERKRFNADARFNLEQEFYLNNTFSDETNITTGIGLFNFDIIEDFLDWRTSFTRTQVLSVSSAADTPDNREERNVFRTGPTVNYRINATNTVALGANFVQVENSDDETADTKRVNGTASYLFQYNSLTSMSLNGSYDEIIESDYDDPLIPGNDDEIQNVSLNVGLNRIFTNGLFGLNLGQSQVRSHDRETITGNFFNLLLQREEFFLHNLSMRYSESISDSSIGFDTLELQLENPDTPDNAGPPSTLEGGSILDIIKRKRFDLSLSRDIDTYQYTFSSYWSDQNYDIRLNDEIAIGAGVSGRQRIQETWTAGLSFFYVKQKFLDNPSVGENITQTTTLDTHYQWTEDVSFNGTVAFQERTNETFSFNEYEEFSISVGINARLY